MISRHLPFQQLRPDRNRTCSPLCLARRAAQRQRTFVPLNAVQDRVKEAPASKQKHANGPDMNAAVTSARQAEKAETASKKSKRRYALPSCK